MTRPKTGKTKTVSFRTTPELYEVLREVARKENRSTSQQIEFYIKRGLYADHNKIV